MAEKLSCDGCTEKDTQFRLNCKKCIRGRYTIDMYEKKEPKIQTADDWVETQPCIGTNDSLHLNRGRREGFEVGDKNGYRRCQRDIKPLLDGFKHITAAIKAAGHNSVFTYASVMFECDLVFSIDKMIKEIEEGETE